ncbi:MAG: nucleotidyl transferase AbiEii/AbiGii toxin family protein [Patescibacteria group bacterium]
MVATAQLNNVLSTLRLDALPLFARDAFLRCATLSLFSRGGWYLAGGTALALQVGHRQSHDLDFFTSERRFSERRIEEELAREKTWVRESITDGTLYGELLGAKVSLIAYPLFKPAEPFLAVGTVSVLTPPDIAAMKITAISQRGRKRDFVDLYWLSRNVQPLAESFKRAQKQYSVRQNPNHIVKSLVYFGDAEADPMPTLFFDATWEDIKKYFRQEVLRIAKKLIGLR